MYTNDDAAAAWDQFELSPTAGEPFDRPPAKSNRVLRLTLLHLQIVAQLAGRSDGSRGGARSLAVGRVSMGSFKLVRNLVANLHVVVCAFPNSSSTQTDSPSFRLV